MKVLWALLISGICLSVTVEASASRGTETQVKPANGWLVKSSSRQKITFSKYKVVGVFQRDNQFIGGSAMADVTKQVEFEFSWPLDESAPPRVLTNIPTKTENSRDGSGVCPAPILKGTYEHFELKTITVIGTMFGLVGERRTPDMDEYVGGGGCKGTHPIQGQVREEQLLVSLPSEFFTGDIPKGRAMKQQEQEWAWTFTPVP